MDKIFDKLGLYDFWATFVPGCVGVFLGQIVTVQLGYGENENIISNNVISYVVCSYLLGLILHEIGHFLQDKVIYRKEPFDIFLKNNNILSSAERELYKRKFEAWLKENELKIQKEDEATRMFFNYCDYTIERKGGASKAAKMQTLYGMSRSLFVFFGMLTIALLIYSLYWQAISSIYLWILMSLFCAFLFYFRMKRFNVIRLKVVMRIYVTLYSEL